MGKRKLTVILAAAVCGAAAADGAEYRDIKALAASQGGEITGYISDTGDYQIKFERGRTYQELEDLSESLQSSDLIESAEISCVAPLDTDTVNYREDPWLNDNVPDDPSGSDWDEDHPEGQNWWAEAVHMPSVWDADLDFQTVKVGILDTGFDITHPDLDDGKFVKLWENPVNEEQECSVSVFRALPVPDCRRHSGTGCVPT